MYDTIATKESVKRKAQAQYERGMQLSDCPMPFNSRAETVWKDEWKRLDAERRATSLMESTTSRSTSA